MKNWYNKLFKYANFDSQNWKDQLHSFLITFMSAKESEKEDWSAENEEEYIHNLLKAFGYWVLRVVPSYLKNLNGDLKPFFKDQVREFMYDSFSFDPYYELDKVHGKVVKETTIDIPELGTEETTKENIQVPTADELENWWGS